MNLQELYGNAEAAKIARQAEAHAAQVALPSLLSGYATWDAMKSAVEQLRRTAPEDHDVVIKISDVTVHEAFFIEPHAFLFKGVNNDGENTWIGLHFSQLVFGVIHRKRRGTESVVTGFCPHAPLV